MYTIKVKMRDGKEYASETKSACKLVSALNSFNYGGGGLVAVQNSPVVLVRNDDISEVICDVDINEIYRAADIERRELEKKRIESIGGSQAFMPEASLAGGMLRGIA